MVIGAGRSAASLIKYFLENARKEAWFVKVGDINKSWAEDKVGNHDHAEAFQLDGLDKAARRKEIKKLILLFQ